MIFVTVGTHEQQFNRLIQKVDELKRDGVIDEEVMIQTGYSTYEPKYCEWKKLLPYNDMIKYVNEARIVITHGGPSSFIMPLQVGKVPIVVPRSLEYGEHVNDHQVEFAKAVAERQRNIIVIENVDELVDKIRDYNQITIELSVGIANNNEKFCKELGEIVREILV